MEDSDLPEKSLSHVPVKQFYSEELAERICELFIEGKSLQSIAMGEEMPAYSTILKWIRDNKGFQKMMEGARQARAAHFEDKVLELSEKAPYLDKDSVGGSRLAFDALKWLGEVNDPTKYGKKTTIEGNPDKPLTFIIQTGFPTPNEYQTPPKLGEDGLIIKTVASSVVPAKVETLSPSSEPALPEGLFEKLSGMKEIAIQAQEADLDPDLEKGMIHENEATEGTGSEPPRIHENAGGPSGSEAG